MLGADRSGLGRPGPDGTSVLTATDYPRVIHSQKQKRRAVRAVVAGTLVLAITVFAPPGTAAARSAETFARASGTAQEPVYRDGDRVGGGGEAEPASSTGTVVFLVSSVAVIGVISTGIALGKRRRRSAASSTDLVPVQSAGSIQDGTRS